MTILLPLLTLAAHANDSVSLRNCQDSDLHVAETAGRQLSRQVTCSQLTSDAAYVCALESKQALGMVDLNCLQMTEAGLDCARTSWKKNQLSNMNCAKIKTPEQKTCAENSLKISGWVDQKCTFN